MYWWPDRNIGDIWHWNPKDVTTIQISKILCHQHHCGHFKPFMTSINLKILRSDLQSVSNVLHWLFKMWRWTKIGKSYFHAKVNFDLVDEQMWRHFWYFLQFLEEELIGTWGIITELTNVWSLWDFRRNFHENEPF